MNANAQPRPGSGPPLHTPPPGPEQPEALTASQVGFTPECNLGQPEMLARILADQKERWQQGERVLVESYLSLESKLDEDGILALIFSEVSLRQKRQDRPGLEEYLRRFPQYQVPIERRFCEFSTLGVEVVSREPAPKGITTGIPCPDAPALPTVAGYELLAELGRGGMGAVYRARELSLNRLVALKMVLAGPWASREALARFQAEAEAVARLQHSHIVQIYEIGRQDGRPYFTMELIDGPSLAEKLLGCPLTVRHAAQLVETLARAVHYAHQRGIAHRDLKPGNILLTADGTPKITDFGIAKRLDQQSGHTQPGDILGTPNYMAPEQAAGNSTAIGPATDVYALGAILYETLTGRHHVIASNWAEAQEQIRSCPPIPPSRFQPRVPRDLETICLKCLEKDPKRRYPTAEALAEDLHAFLAGGPIQAQPANPLQRAAGWAQRRPTAASMVAVGAAAIVGLIVGAWLYNAVAMGALTVLGLLAGAGWYNARLQGALRDLKREHLLFQRSMERLQLLMETTQRLMSVPDLDTLLCLLTETTTRLANAERASIFLIDSARNELYSRVAMGNGVQSIRVPLGLGIAGTVAATGETINIPDVYADKRFNPAVDRDTGYKTRSLLAFPMTGSGGRIFGVFEVLNKRGGPFEPEDVELLWYLASAAALALQNTRSYPSESLAITQGNLAAPGGTGATPSGSGPASC